MQHKYGLYIHTVLSYVRIRVSKVILAETISIRDTIKVLAVLAEFGVLYQIEY